MMTDVSGVNASYYFSDQSGQSGMSSALGKEAFMNLLVTQLRYQDPLEPMENTEFVAQLAQFSSLEQLWNMNGNLETNVLLIQSLQNSMMAGLIGREIRLLGNSIVLPESGQVSLHYSIEANAKVTVEIMDSTGSVVRTLQLGTQEAGNNQCLWDGEDELAQKLDAGIYTFRVQAADQAGNEVSSTTYTVGSVTGVRFLTGNPILLIGNLEVSPSDIIEIR